MNVDGVWAALLAAGIGGCLIGILAALVWRARREQSLRVELEVLRARIRSDETAPPRNGTSRSRALREQLQGVFGDLARDSLKSNSEVFLQLARERLAAAVERRGRGAQGTRDRDRIAGAADPRDAGPHRGADSEHRARAHRLVRHHQEPDGKPGERPEHCCRARPAIS